MKIDLESPDTIAEQPKIDLESPDTIAESPYENATRKITSGVLYESLKLSGA